MYSYSCTALEQPWEDTPCPRWEKSQQDGRCWSSGCTALDQLWGDTPCPRERRSPSKVVQFSSVQFSRSVVSDSLWPHESQHARPLYTSPTSGVHSDGRRGEFTCRLKPHSHQRCSEGSNKPCAHQDPEAPQKLRQNCVWGSPVKVWVSSGLLPGRDSGCSRLGYGISPLGGGHH